MINAGHLKRKKGQVRPWLLMVGEIHSSPERYAKNCSVVFRKGHTTECAWKVPAQEIVARNDHLDCKNPHEVEVNYRNPEELMQEYLEITRQLETAQNTLKAELMVALGGAS